MHMYMCIYIYIFDDSIQYDNSTIQLFFVDRTMRGSHWRAVQSRMRRTCVPHGGLHQTLLEYRRGLPARGGEAKLFLFHVNTVGPRACEKE